MTGDAGDERGRSSGGPTITAVERAADVLLYLAGDSRPTVGVTEIATDLGISKAVVHRILASLRTRDLVELEPSTRRYRLGPMATLVGLASLNRLNLRALVVPVLNQLAFQTNETATMSVRTGWSRVYVEQVTPRREIIMSVAIGVPYPLHAGASSKALLAFLPEDEIEEYLEGTLSRLTEFTVTHVDALRDELATIRRRGWASSAQERQHGASAVAAPILDHDGAPVAVLSVGGPSERFEAELDDCAALVARAAADLSQQYGYRGTFAATP